MYVTYLKLISFRGFSRLDLSLSPGKNLVFGPNGSGKTSILEAVFVLAFGKTFQAAGRTDLIRYGAEGFFLEAGIWASGNEHEITFQFKDQALLRIDDKKASLAEVKKKLHPVVFSSASYNYLAENQTALKKQCDRFVFGLDSLYLSSLLRYNHALRQKNCLLKGDADFPQLDSWNHLLAEQAAEIVKSRKKFTAILNAKVKAMFHIELELLYRPSVNETNRDAYYSALIKRRQEECRARRSICGTHRDQFYWQFAGKPLSHSSSGEKKTRLLLAFMAYLELFKEINGDFPVFLIDDFDTALDRENLALLLSAYPRMQIVATSVHRHDGFDQELEISKENPSGRKAVRT